MQYGYGEVSILPQDRLRHVNSSVFSERFWVDATKDQDARLANEIIHEQLDWLKRLEAWIQLKRTDIAIQKTECQLLLLEIQKFQLLLNHRASIV